MIVESNKILISSNNGARVEGSKEEKKYQNLADEPENFRQSQGFLNLLQECIKHGIGRLSLRAFSDRAWSLDKMKFQAKSSPSFLTASTEEEKDTRSGADVFQISTNIAITPTHLMMEAMLAGPRRSSEVGIASYARYID